MLLIHGSHNCSCESTSCIYCVSRVQQAYEVAKLFQSSHHNLNNGPNDSQYHNESPPSFCQGSTIDTKSIAFASSSLRTISQYQTIQPNLQSAQQQTLYLAPPSTDASKENQKDSESLIIELNDNKDPSLIVKTEYFVQESTLQSVSDQVSVCNKSTKKTPKINIDDPVQFNTLSLSLPAKANVNLNVFDKTESALKTSSNNESQSSPKTSRLVRALPCKAEKQKDCKQIKCQCPNCSSESGNRIRRPDGRPIHLCQVSDCRKFFDRPWRLRKHLVEVHSDEKNADVKKRRNGDRLHVCPVAECAKNLSSKITLKRHLEWHKGRKNFFCEYCKEGFQYKCNIKSHITRHINGLKITKRTICQCPYCTAEGGNKTRGPNGKLLHICHTFGCAKIFAQRNSLKKHLDWHSSEKKTT